MTMKHDEACRLALDNPPTAISQFVRVSHIRRQTGKCLSLRQTTALPLVTDAHAGAAQFIRRRHAERQFDTGSNQCAHTIVFASHAIKALAPTARWREHGRHVGVGELCRHQMRFGPAHQHEPIRWQSFRQAQHRENVVGVMCAHKHAPIGAERRRCRRVAERRLQQRQLTGHGVLDRTSALRIGTDLHVQTDVLVEQQTVAVQLQLFAEPTIAHSHQRTHTASHTKISRRSHSRQHSIGNKISSHSG
mmetsp:Transcript_22478/g.38067  ORF Transcript_22478/g.38067 Transcript_22478/m.38067 type:complete len:248 (-) Transcript_22478:1168-1911(-)